MMNGIPNHQQPPMQGARMQPPPMTNGPPGGPGLPQSQMYGGMPPKQNPVPVPNPSVPSASMPMQPNKQFAGQPPVPMNQLPPGQFAPPQGNLHSHQQPPQSHLPPVPGQMSMNRPPGGPLPPHQHLQQNGFSANSSRTASPAVNLIPAAQLPPGPPQHPQPPPGNVMNTPNRLDLQPNSALNANFTPLKASTPQYGSPIVPQAPPSVAAPPTPAQLSASVQALNQGVQNMNLNYVNGNNPPQTTNGHSAPPAIHQQPQQQQQQQQRPPGGGIPPPMAQRYPPVPQQQQPLPPQPSAVPSMGMGGGGGVAGFPPMPPTSQPAGMFGANTMAQQPLQYQNQMQPPKQMHAYPQQAQGQQPGHQFQLHSNNNNNNIQRGNLSVTQQGFNRLWGMETVDLMQNRHILPPEPVQPPAIKLNNQLYESVNCSPDVFRCTLTKIPETKELLNKSRLPLGVLIHPFRDINKLPVIQCSEIVRCRACRTYINPFVYFVDSMKWKCNLCYRVNELPKEFQYDPITKTYGDVTRRPEVKSSTIEFIASSEYMLRPPPPAVYLFLLDVSSIAVQSGYLNVVCQTISNHLDELPGDARTQVGFVAFNSAIHFYNIAEGFNQPHEITVLDVDDVFLPCPDNLCVNLKECKELIKDLLVQLPKRFSDAHDPKSALGAALQAAFKMIGTSGGRVTVFQTCLPNEGPGALLSREDPNNRSSKDVPHLGPATDFYKRHALECSGQQIAVDLFVLNSQYCDIATLAGISKYSGGCMHHFPLFSHTKAQQVDALKASLERYLTRKIGFEAVMRIRCTRGLAIHTFHGNFFVRSTDLLSLPNVNPDAGFAMQIAHEESLTDLKSVCFQAALLYTSSKGERRIRVHTLCLPVVNQLSEIMTSADSQAIAGLLVKMAVDRSLTSTLADAREAFINATVDILSAFKLAQNLPAGQVIAPMNLALLPLYINAIMKHIAFRTGMSTRLDDRAFAMCEMKTLPLGSLIRYIYPDFYNIDCLFMNLNGGEKANDEDRPDPPRMQLSAEKLDSRSIFLMDTGPHMMIYVGTNANPQLVQKLFGVEHVGAIPDLCYSLQNNNSAESEALFAFIDYINEDKPYPATIQIIRDSSSYRAQFTEKFVDDRTESALSYYEFLQHLRSQVK